MTRADAKVVVMDSLVRRVFAVVHGWTADQRYRAYKPLLEPSSGWRIVDITKETCVENERGANLLRVSMNRREPGSIQGTYFCVEI